MGRHASTAAVLVALSGCVPRADVDLPGGDRVQTTIVAVMVPERTSAGAGATVELHVLDHRAPSSTVLLAVAKETTLVALQYEDTLEELQLQAGALTPVEDGRPLPRWEAALYRTGGSEGWRSAGRDPELEGELDLVRIPAFDTERCVAGGACIEGAEDPRCADPCPEPSRPRPPFEPAAPHVQVATCPDGKIGALLGGTGDPLCEPPPSVQCPDGQRRSNVSQACEPPIHPCPEGDYAEGLPEGAPILYVRAGAPAGGDGTPSRPFGTIRAAHAVASAGTIVAVSKGTFTEAIQVPGGVTLWGACPDGTRLTITATTSAVLTPSGADVVVRGVELWGGRSGASVWTAGRSLHLEDVRIAGPGDYGVIVHTGGSLSARGLWIRDRRQTALHFYRGGQSGDGGLEEVLIELAGDAGVRAVGAGTRVLLSGATLRHLGHGVIVRDGAEVEARALVADDLRGNGLLACDPGTSLSVLGAEISRAGAAPTGGSGVMVCAAATATVAKVLVEATSGRGVFSRDPGSMLTIRELVARDISADTGGPLDGPGACAYSQGGLTLQDALITRVGQSGLFTAGIRSSVRAERLVVRGVTRGAEPVGRAVFATDLARAQVSGAWMEEADLGAVLVNAGASVALEDTVIRDGFEDSGPRTGLEVVDATLGATRVTIDDTKGSAVFAARAALVLTDTSALGPRQWGVRAEHSQVTMTRVSLEGAGVDCIKQVGDPSRLMASDLRLTRCGGHGLRVEDASVVELNRTSVRDVLQRGVALYTGDTSRLVAIVEDLSISGVSADEACRDQCRSAGLELERVGAWVHRFEITGSDATGALIEGQGPIHLEEGLLHGNELALELVDVEVLIPLFDRVLRRDNPADYTRTGGTP